MKILAEINTETHAILEIEVLQQILEELHQIKETVQIHHTEKVAVNLKGAAKMLGCTYDFAKELYHNGKLRGRQEKPGATILIDTQSIRDYIKQGEELPTGPQFPEHTQEITMPLSDNQMIALQRRLSKK